MGTAGWKVLSSNPKWRTNINYLKKVEEYISNGFIITKSNEDLILSQSDGIILGRLDPNDVYFPNEMRVLGSFSKRHFDPTDMGGLIIKKSWKDATITQTGIDDIKVHLSRFEDFEGNNAFMIDRLQQIKNGQIPISDFDKRFYTHELEEFSRYKAKGIANGTNNENFYYNAHTASLEVFSINEISSPIYHPR